MKNNLDKIYVMGFDPVTSNKGSVGIIHQIKDKPTLKIKKDENHIFNLEMTKYYKISENSIEEFFKGLRKKYKN